MKTRRFGVTEVAYIDSGAWWYMIVTPPLAAVCTRHGPAHLHRHPMKHHPDHRPAIPIDPGLSLQETRLEALCGPLGRGPGFDELRKVLS